MNISTISGLCIALVGLIHLLPGVGVLGVERLNTLYGIPIQDNNLEILMRHRAVLFALLGAFMLASAFYPPWRAVAYGFAWVSVLSFLGLAAWVGETNLQLNRVVRVDWLAVVLLALGSAVEIYQCLNRSSS